ncbi:hypothetical protein [Saccharococcus thermophilus]
MEKYFSPEQLAFIKEQCYKEVHAETVIKELGQSSIGKLMQSTYIYKKVFVEEEYHRLLRLIFIRDILPQLEKKKKRKKKEIGRNITQKEFFKTIFRDHFDHRRGELDKKGRKIYLKAFLFDIDHESKLINRQTVINSLDKLIIRSRKYNYFTPNMFISHKFFTKEMLSLLGAFILDFDLDKHKIVMTKEELYYYIFERIKAYPAMIWDTKTKGNYQACILIEPMTGTPSSVYLYEQVLQEMIRKLEIADDACKNANHIYAIGKNNPRESKFIRKYNEIVYNINDFRWLLKERDERRRKEAEAGVKILDFTTEAIRKHPAIKALFEAENIYLRDHACFTLALVMKFLGYSQEECENYILSEWQPKVDNIRIYGEHFTVNEALKCIRHAYSDKYKCFHSDWVEICTGIECNLRGYFRFNTYESKGIYQTKNKQKLIDYLRTNGGIVEGNRKTLAEATGINILTLKDILEQMKKDGELYYEEKRGRGAKTIFVLTEMISLKKMENIIEFDLFKMMDEFADNDPVNNILILEKAIKEMSAI